MHALISAAIVYVFVPSSANNIMTSSVDIDRAIGIRDRYGSHFIWVKRQGVVYVIRDAATLDAIEHLFDAERALDPEMQALHEKMRPLERRENRLDKEMDAISDDDDHTAADEARLHDLRREMDDVERQLAVLEREEEALDAKQERLEAEAEKRMEPIIDEAIRKGLAKRE